MTNAAKKSLEAFLIESLSFPMERKHALLINNSIIGDVAQDISETAGEDYSSDNIRLSVGRVLCNRLNLES